MARLNEPAHSATEPVDVLKRRFVRQNREIAKANSAQSLRIRNLEGEVSRLLGENVSLREQIIKLHYEVESNAGKPDSNKIESFKMKLEAKLKEVGNLVQELGDVQRDAKRSGQQKRKSLNSKSSPKKSPNQRIWKNSQSLSDLMGDADGRLPPIMEDKHFPRQTLDSDELNGMFADTANLTDSPDLGPPPIAHFDEGDPIKFDTRDCRQVSKDSVSANEAPNPPFSANLETRKKRRESMHQRNTSSKVTSVDVDKLSNSTKPTENSSQPFKAGAKRKLHLRDEDEPSVGQVEKDEFQFNRKETSQAVGKATGPKISERTNLRTERFKEASKENTAPIPSTARKALGPKNINTDPQSPAKVTKVGANDKPISTREVLAQRIKDRENKREKSRAKQSVEPRNSIAETTKPQIPEVPASTEPETPAALTLDLFSPTSTEPSARAEGRGDTPPPPDLGPDTGTGSFGRASRRSRGTVSYAEPSLRDKMRRPTKELVDAVQAEERARQARANESNAVRIKQEEDDAEPLPNWKTIPVGESKAQKERERAETTSPLGKKAAAPASDLPASIITDRRRRTSSISKRDDEVESAKKGTSSAAFAIAALAKPKHRRDPTDSINKVDEVEPQTHSDKTSIFDFTGSSPDVGGRNLEKEEAERTFRFSRRHSSVPALSDHGKGSLSISRRTDKRRESSVRLDGRDTAAGEEAGPESKSMKTVASLEAGMEELSVARGERAANRRRSMML